MPIFNNEITFIHIPKCGGTSIENFMVENGYKMTFFNRTFNTLINNHSAQHCTLRELDELGLSTDKIFTIVRSDVDRTISEYYYCKDWRYDINNLFSNFDEFLDLFLDKTNTKLFDQHNISYKEFIINSEGIIDERLTVFDFFDIDGIEKYLGVKGLENYCYYKTNKTEIITDDQIERIKNFFM